MSSQDIIVILWHPTEMGKRIQRNLGSNNPFLFQYSSLVPLYAQCKALIYGALVFTGLCKGLGPAGDRTHYPLIHSRMRYHSTTSAGLDFLSVHVKVNWVIQTHALFEVYWRSWLLTRQFCQSPYSDYVTHCHFNLCPQQRIMWLLSITWSKHGGFHIWLLLFHIFPIL